MLSYNPPNLWNYGSKLDIDSLVNTRASALSSLTISNTGFISSPITNTTSIVNLSSVNDVSYNNPQFSTLTINQLGYLSTIAINGLSTINGIAVNNQPSIDRASGTSDIIITAITSTTAQLLGSLTLTTTFLSNIDINALVMFQNSSGSHDISMFFRITPPGGIATKVGHTYTGSLNGAGHYITMPLQATALNIAPGDVVIQLYTFANQASVFTASNRQLSAIGNLVKG
jgi:hypothetical protein